MVHQRKARKVARQWIQRVGSKTGTDLWKSNPATVQDLLLTEDSVQKKFVEIWTDGACWPNPGGPGSWAAILRYQEYERTISGFSDSEANTNNRMEIMGAIKGLELLKESCQVTVYSDSQYLVRSMSRRWRKKKNADLWEQVHTLCSIHKVTWQWVRGHADNELNNRCDELANKELMKRGIRDESRKFRR